jgi:hypothetical protein
MSKIQQPVQSVSEQRQAGQAQLQAQRSSHAATDGWMRGISTRRGSDPLAQCECGAVQHAPAVRVCACVRSMRASSGDRTAAIVPAAVR